MEAPKVGDIVKGRDIGRALRGEQYIWHACLWCGKARWVRIASMKLPKFSGMCRNCANVHTLKASGEVHPNWKGGKQRARGYIRIPLCPDDFFYPMATKDGYVMEHRLIMAQSIGRCLHSWEIVHHKNGVRDDNRTVNLQLVTDERHTQITLLENEITKLKNKLVECEKLKQERVERIKREIEKDFEDIQGTVWQLNIAKFRWQEFWKLEGVK